jgi:hypothetical protein
MREIPYALQQITSDDVNAVMAALQAPMLTQGPLCERFETRFADAVGARFAMAISSGTAALHGAYAAAGVQAGRDGRTTRIKFAATANAAHYLGARVKFVDIDPASALVDTEAVNLVDPPVFTLSSPCTLPDTLPIWKPWLGWRPNVNGSWLAMQRMRWARPVVLAMAAAIASGLARALWYLDAVSSRAAYHHGGRWSPRMVPSWRFCCVPIVPMASHDIAPTCAVTMGRGTTGS